MLRLMTDTPVEEYTLRGRTVLVKREDQAAPYPGPPFSKVRGLVPYLEDLKEIGLVNIGYVETSISMAGWGVAWACHHLGLHCIIWDPQYKETPPLLAYHREQWKKFDAEIRPIKAGMAAVNFNIAAKEMRGMPESFLLPLGLPLPTTVSETAKIARETWNKREFDTVVISVGSGTICAGLLLGLPPEVTIHGVMCRTGNITRKYRNIYTKACMPIGGLLGHRNLRLYDPYWEYTDRSEVDCPFPSHPNYDLKAWEWLLEAIDQDFMVEDSILFWNIGR